MRILLVSRVWPRDERSGVSLCAAVHAQIIIDCGHDLAIVGSARSGGYNLGVSARTYLIKATGGMSLYSPPRVCTKAVNQVISRENPDLVVIEGWQTALTEAFAWCACRAGRRVLVISHGVALAPYMTGFAWWVRALAWKPYRVVWLPRIVRKISWLTALDANCSSDRFLDRDLARQAGTPVSVLTNAPINWSPARSARHERRMQVLCVGYFSPVKNQLAVIRLADAVRDLRLSFVLVGSRSGSYFERCRADVRRSGLTNSVSFLDDCDISIGEEIARSVAVISASLTEVLPIVLLEAMASGTPFIAPEVGAIPRLRGGLFANTDSARIHKLRELLADDCLWAKCAREGIDNYEARFTNACVASALVHAIQCATR